MNPDSVSDIQPQELDPNADNKPLWPNFLIPVLGIAAVLVVARFATLWAIPDRYVIDFYPSTEDTRPIAVIRWPSRQLQLDPIQLPRTLSADGRWQGKQPKRATLRPDTILPAGEILEFDESSPPGRFVIILGNNEIEISPDSPWRRGEWNGQSEPAENQGSR